MKFSPDLASRVRGALDRRGYCFLNRDEIERLISSESVSRSSQQEALMEFARMCGAEVETTPHLKSARFVPASASRGERRVFSGNASSYPACPYPRVS